MAGQVRRLPRWLDRAGFEADKMMRANRVRTEATRIREQADNKVLALGAKALELAAAGVELQPELQQFVSEITALRVELARKEDEIKGINAETWIEPTPPPPPPPPPDPVAQRLQAYVDLTAKSSDFNCPKCGALIRTNKTFCPQCGRKVIR